MNFLFALEGRQVRVVDFEPTDEDVEKSAAIAQRAIQRIVDKAGENVIHMNAFEFFIAFAISLSCIIITNSPEVSKNEGRHRSPP